MQRKALQSESRLVQLEIFQRKETYLPRRLQVQIHVLFIS